VTIVLFSNVRIRLLYGQIRQFRMWL